MWGAVLSEDNTVHLLTWIQCGVNGEERAEGENLPEYQIDVLQNLFSKRSRLKAVLHILIQASPSQYWITRELLWCFCMQHMIYYCTFCCAITASEDNVLLGKFSSANCLCTLFFLLINCLKWWDWLIHRLFSTCSCWQCAILTPWCTHPFIHVIYVGKQTPQDSGSCLYTHQPTSICIVSVDVCSISYRRKCCEKNSHKARCCLLYLLKSECRHVICLLANKDGSHNWLWKLTVILNELNIKADCLMPFYPK